MRTVEIDLLEHLFEECIDEVANSGEPIVVVRDGKSIARVEPIDRKHGMKSLWGLHEGQIEILGDIIAPIDVRWDVDD